MSFEPKGKVSIPMDHAKPQSSGRAKGTFEDLARRFNNGIWEAQQSIHSCRVESPQTDNFVDKKEEKVTFCYSGTDDVVSWYFVNRVGGVFSAQTLDHQLQIPRPQLSRLSRRRRA